jgi:hypothetical protein
MGRCPNSRDEQQLMRQDSHERATARDASGESTARAQEVP